MNIENITSIITTFATVISLFLVLHQIWLARRGIEADHLRRKKDATFNGFNLIREDFRQLNNEILEALELSQDSNLDESHFTKIRNDHILLGKLRTILSYIERMAVGVKHDIYDLNILVDLSGTVFVRTYDRYLPYILESRDSSTTYYREADDFIKQLRSLRKIRISEIKSERLSHQ